MQTRRKCCWWKINEICKNWWRRSLPFLHPPVIIPYTTHFDLIASNTIKIKMEYNMMGSMPHRYYQSAHLHCTHDCLFVSLKDPFGSFLFIFLSKKTIYPSSQHCCTFHGIFYLIRVIYGLVPGLVLQSRGCTSCCGCQNRNPICWWWLRLLMVPGLLCCQILVFFTFRGRKIDWQGTEINSH